MDAGPEKPRHIDRRITRIDTDQLIQAFGAPVGVQDLPGLRRWLGPRMRRPAWPLPEWAAAVAGTAGADEILADAAPLLGTLDVTGAGLGRSQRYGFHYLHWLRAGVSAWLLSEDIRYLEGFERHLLDWCAQRDQVVGEWLGLDPIWYSLGTWARCEQFLPTLEVLTDSPLSDAGWAALLTTLIGGARWAYDEHDTFRHGNWQLLSAAELMHIAHVLPDLGEATAWYARGRARLMEHLRIDVYPDGGHYERSPGYHAICLSAVQTAVLIDAASSDSELRHRAAAMHRWLIDLADPAGWIPALQDSGVVWIGPYLLRGGYALDDPLLIARARSVLAPDDFAALAAHCAQTGDPARRDRWQRTLRQDPERLPAPPPTRLLPESGYAIAGCGPDSAPLKLVINFGPYIEHELESHSHRATLDLVLSGWGVPLLSEAGGPPHYDDPDYQSWYRSGRAHNTVLVDDIECADDRQARCQLFTRTPPLPAGTPAAPAPGGVTVFAGSHRGNGFPQHRMVLLIEADPGYLLLFDDAEPDRLGHRFALHLQSPTSWQRIDADTKPAGLCFDAVPQAGAGLRAVELGDPDTTTITTHTGRGRRPVPGTASDELADLHTLVLGRDTGRFRTLLWPVSPDPQHRSEPRVGRDGEAVLVDHTQGTDRVTQQQWSRRHGESWQGAGWQTDRLRDDQGPLIDTAGPVCLSARTSGGRLEAVIDSSARCRVRLRGRWPRLLLDDIGIEPTLVGGDTELTLPYAGRWRVSGAGDD